MVLINHTLALCILQRVTLAVPVCRSPISSHGWLHRQKVPFRFLADGGFDRFDEGHQFHRLVVADVVDAERRVTSTRIVRISGEVRVRRCDAVEYAHRVECDNFIVLSQQYGDGQADVPGADHWDFYDRVPLLLRSYKRCRLRATCPAGTARNAQYSFMSGRLAWSTGVGTVTM